jgi:HSP20 family molecular chaperone IbpA
MNPTQEVTTRRPTTSQAWDDMIRRMDREMARVRDKAFALFQMRRPEDGTELDDWFRAERELFAEFPSAMEETEKEVTLEVGVPGFEAKDLTVTVLPESMLIEGGITKTENGVTETREFLRHFPLSCVIRTEGVKATLDNGKLTVKAEKQPAPVAVKPEAVKPEAKAATV